MQFDWAQHWWIPLLLVVIGGVLNPILQRLIFSTIDALRKGPHTDVSGVWSCEWYVAQADGTEELYSRDKVEMESPKGMKVTGSGLDDKGKYKLTGELSTRGPVVLNYSSHWKGAGMAGSAVILVSPDGKSADGAWCGYTKESKVVHGRTVWKRL